MRITKEEIEAAKRGHDLREVIESYGVKLRKKGATYVGLCPFHEEKSPSFTVNPKTNLWHCFGCNAGKKRSDRKPGESASAPPLAPSSVNRTRLLNRVVSFYHQSFCEDARALEYLKARGITDKEIFADFRIGYSNGTLLNTVPAEGEIREALQEIGILNGKGHEMFYGCVIFPVFDENQDCVGLYGCD